ncbi:acetyltransferase-like isoleucine patch superfamily enzyme [Nitrobacteraceae bacterium AZCC 2161]|jgi:acetyltransferase-like isoleucine patch superfamily enzyme
MNVSDTKPTRDPNADSEDLFAQLKALVASLQGKKRSEFGRHVSLGDLFTERDGNAAAYGFGEGTTMYDNVLVLGNVKVGRKTWIGPNVILDGSGGLEIGDFCDISAGVQIYSHHTVRRTISMGVDPIDYCQTKIGSGVYIGPNSIIQMGVTIGDRVIIGAGSFVNADLPSGVKAYGIPARPGNTADNQDKR